MVLLLKIKREVFAIFKLFQVPFPLHIAPAHEYLSDIAGKYHRNSSLLFGLAETQALKASLSPSLWAGAAEQTGAEGRLTTQPRAAFPLGVSFQNKGKSQSRSQHPSYFGRKASKWSGRTPTPKKVLTCSYILTAGHENPAAKETFIAEN